jgi:hypothetical protein
MTERFLILRCHPRDTLPIADNYPSLFCPRTTMTIRKGPSRQREKIQVPILPSFLFLPLPNFDDLPSPPFNSRLHIMKRPQTPLPPSQHPHIFPDGTSLPPQSAYAYCTRDEIDIMVTHFPSTTFLDLPFGLGSIVEVITGLLQGCTGTVAQIRTNGDISLKIQQHLGWQINTCIVNAAVLRSL